MSITEKYPLLGHKVRDRITGFTGFAISANDTLTGMLQYAIAPECKADALTEMPSAKLLDYHTLDKVDPEGVFHAPMEPADDAWLDIGAQVRDRIVAANIGIITERIISLNGCVYYSVTLQKTAAKTDQVEPTLFHSYRRFEVIGPGLNAAYKAQEAKDTSTADGKPEMKKPGGPVRNMHPMMGR